MIDALVLPTARAIRIEAVARPTARLELPKRSTPATTARIGVFASSTIATSRSPTRSTPASTHPHRVARSSAIRLRARRYTEAILDAGDSGRPDAIALEAAEPTFFNRVEISDAPDDRATWRVTRDDGLIYRVRGSDGSCEPCDLRRQGALGRVRVFGPERFSLDGATVARDAANAPAMSPPAQSDQRLASASDDHHRLRFRDRKRRGGRAALRCGATRVRRNVTVEASDDAVGWRRVSDGSIARYAYGAPQLT